MTRKGARSRADVPPDVLARLNDGSEQTLTLPEALAVDFAALMRACFPQLDATPLDQAAAEGITRRMAVAARLGLAAWGAEAIARFAAHPSDTVRGWAAFAIGQAELGLEQRLMLVRPLAGDAHFGVREWAWLGIRPAIVAEPLPALDMLTGWTADCDAHIRRFASEATRPRGVWCAHIPALRADPRPGLKVLAPLRADAARYVQDSVANWLNDAGKDHPDWVRALCRDWAADAAPHIRKRAQRNL